MKCKDCPYLIKTESVEIAGWWELYCEKYIISHCPVSNGNLKYLCCVEDERRRRMSDLWAYRPEKCDGDYCLHDCDRCYKRDDEEDEDDESGRTEMPV